ncbi:hypothetical protein CBS101457_004914 [Exobasidium rhododendri]|nr:hypothetical protein CBS101457_004914 [Exobasidium rhododendri]
MTSASSWESLAMTTKTYEVEKLFVYASFGTFLFDTLLSLGFDWSVIMGKYQRRWPQLLYFSVKILYLAFISLYVATFWFEREVNCRAFMIVLQTFMGLIAITSSALLACRSICVYFGTARKIIAGFLIAFGIAITVAWMCGGREVTFEWSTAAASSWNTGACMATAIKYDYFIKYLFIIFFDFAVLALTVFGIFRMGANSRIGDILKKQGLIYFVATLVVNFVISVLTALKLSPTMSLVFAAPQLLVCVIASTRLYRSLIEEGIVRSHVSSGVNSGVQSLNSKSGSSSSSSQIKSTGARSSLTIQSLFKHQTLSSSTDDSTPSGMDIETVEKGLFACESGVHVEQTQEVTVSELPVESSSSDPYHAGTDDCISPA